MFFSTVIYIFKRKIITSLKGPECKKNKMNRLKRLFSKHVDLKHCLTKCRAVLHQFIVLERNISLFRKSKYKSGGHYCSNEFIRNIVIIEAKLVTV